jgi:hypothetical protein
MVAAIIMAYRYSMEREATEVAQALATSLAPGAMSAKNARDADPCGSGNAQTDIPSVEKRKDGADGEEVVELVERHLGNLPWIPGP